MKSAENHNLITQIIRFVGVGGICFVIDFACLHIFAEYVHFSVLLSAALAFCISVVVNYYMSVKFVFSVSEELNQRNAFAVFILMSIIGLLLTELIMYLGTDIMMIGYHIVKIAATAIVMVFNFVTRKIFLEN